MTLSPIVLATSRHASTSMTRTAFFATSRASRPRNLQRTPLRAYATGTPYTPYSGGRAGLVIGGVVSIAAGLWFFARGDAAGGAHLKDQDTTGDKAGRSPTRSPEKPEGNTKVISDPKGGAKKRIDSDYQTNVGENASSGKSGNMNTQAGKQAGLSNTDTRHSTDISKNSDKSTKGEGTAETAKLQGSVDPGRRPG